MPGEKPESVHLAYFPEIVTSEEDAELLRRWDRIFEIREAVLKSLEEARTEKLIGSSLEAKVILSVNEETLMFLKPYADELRYIFIVSQVELNQSDELKIEVKRADGNKCERCWNYSVKVGEFHNYPTICERCFEALKEFEEGVVV